MKKGSESGVEEYHADVSNETDMSIPKNKNLEQKISHILADSKIPETEKPEGIPYFARYVQDFPVDFLINIVDFNNYRQHSLKDVMLLASSIKHERVLQPVVLNYDTLHDSWELVAGEGRSWGYYLSKAVFGPVQIYYDLPPEILLRMKIATNSTKTPIDSEDLAKYTQGLYALLNQYNADNSQFKDFVKAGTSLEDLSKILHRSPKTVSGYLAFNNLLHKNIQGFVDSHREMNLYWRSVKIAKVLPNKNHQLQFFFKMLEDEESRKTMELEKKANAAIHHKSYHMKEVRSSSYMFMKELKKFAATVSEPTEAFSMKPIISKHRAGDTLLKDLHSKCPQTLRYIDAFKNIIEQYYTLKNGLKGRILDHIQVLKNNYDRMMQFLPENLGSEIKEYLSKPPEKSLKQLVMEQAEKSRMKDITDKLSDVDKVLAIGEKIVYIPIDGIILEKSQLRSRYKKESIDALATEISVYGQVDPGLVSKVAIDGITKYKIIFGHSRYKAAVQAGQKFYKAFVREDLSDVEVALLQAVEDLSESDSPVERAKIINKQYHLMKMRAEHENRMYSKEDFIKEFHHFGNKKILKDALDFWELDEGLRNMAASRQVSYDATLKIGQLKEDDRLNVLYNVMTSRLKGEDLDKYIKKVKAHSGLKPMFEDIPVSYHKIIEEFEKESLKPFRYLETYLSNENVRDRIMTPQVIVHYAQIYKSVLSLEKSINL